MELMNDLSTRTWMGYGLLVLFSFLFGYLQIVHESEFKRRSFKVIAIMIVMVIALVGGGMIVVFTMAKSNTDQGLIMYVMAMSTMFGPAIFIDHMYKIITKKKKEISNG